MEIAIFGEADEQKATLSFSTHRKNQFRYLQTSNVEAIEFFYLRLWENFQRSCQTTISSRSDVWRWLIDFEDPEISVPEKAVESLSQLWKALPFNWDSIANLYKDQVRGSNLEFFKSYFKGETEKVLEKIEMAASDGEFVVMDFGCGTGSTIKAIAEFAYSPENTQQAITRNLRHILGVDDAALMIAESYRVREGLGSKGREVSLWKLDIQELAEYIENGRISSFPAGQDSRSVGIDRAIFENCRKFGCLMNVLPNIPRIFRLPFLRRIASTLSSGDQILVSTYNGLRFGDFQRKVYGSIPNLTGAYENRLDLPASLRTYVNPERDFVSHWFTLHELELLVESAGFKKVDSGYFPEDSSNRDDLQGVGVFVLARKSTGDESPHPNPPSA